MRRESPERRINHDRGYRQHVSSRADDSARLSLHHGADKNGYVKRMPVLITILVFAVSVLLMFTRSDFMFLNCLVAFIAVGYLVFLTARHLLDIGVWKVRR